MMFMFGFVWGCVNGIVALLYYGEPSKGRFKCAQRLLKIILFPVFLFLVIMPFFGGWIVPPIVQKVSPLLINLLRRCSKIVLFQWAWNHDCDNFPMFVVIDAVSATAPNTATNLLHFYQQNAQNPMFTYETSNPAGNGDFWNFALREWDQAQGSIPSQYYPTLQQVTYDFINDSFSGNCTVSTPGNDGTVNVPCTNGTFFSNSFLSFNITSNVPLNGTANPTSLPSNTTQLRTQANRWTSVSNSAPSLTLVTVDPLTNKLQNDIVLRTAVTHGSDCAELKVCVGGVNGQMAGLVGAETLIPLGFIMLQQENYAIVCTAPDDDGGD